MWPFKSKPKKCQHRGGTATTFHALADLRELFSGRMSIEEYSALPDKPMFTTECLKCGEILCPSKTK